jgi:putative DNA primase/helicase
MNYIEQIKKSIKDIIGFLPNEFSIDGKYYQTNVDGNTYYIATDKQYPYVVRYGCHEKGISKKCPHVDYNELPEFQKKHYDDALARMRAICRSAKRGDIELETHGDYSVSVVDDEEELQYVKQKPLPSPFFKPGELLSDIKSVICKHVDLNSHAAVAFTLWVAFTWFVREFYISPILIISTNDEHPENKSTAFSLLSRLSENTVRVSAISPSIFLRTLDRERPTTLLYDDPLIIKNRGMLNLIANSYNQNDAVILHGGSDGDKVIHTFGAKALASSDGLPSTIKIQGISIDLTQQSNGIRCERLTSETLTSLSSLKEKLDYFSNIYRDEIRETKPEMPICLKNSALDNWEPLFKIAMIAGDNWLNMANLAAKQLSDIDDKTVLIREQLLFDVKNIVNDRISDYIRTKTLISRLCDKSDRSWAIYNRGDKITAAQLARLMKPFGIKSKLLRIKGIEKPVKRGYLKSKIVKAYARYIECTAA